MDVILYNSEGQLKRANSLGYEVKQVNLGKEKQLYIFYTKEFNIKLKFACDTFHRKKKALKY